MSEQKKNSYKDAWKYITSDYVRYGYSPNLCMMLIRAILCLNHCFAYTFWLRLGKVSGFLYPISKLKHLCLSRKYGIQIPITTEIGYGFYIGHGVGLIINETAKIGNNVNVSQFSTIGAHGVSAVIGDNVYLGPSVCIVNKVNIGHNVTVGAGAVVVKDIPDNATVVGVPARVINFNQPGRYVNNRYLL